ncbi:hypothetical protein AB2L28_01270 [Kineococcus sp. TBRC 1896]|uniref:PH (Pleckstrin Homology) domain-containing protein n=1 Tax=Kineococcus mangrovi TaxID=1660183 RepID=A0ABV4HWS4_9ACTN
MDSHRRWTPDLTGLPGSYRRPVQRKAVVLLTVSAACGTASVLLRDRHTVVDVVLAVVWSGLLLATYALEVVWRPGVVLHPDGVRTGRWNRTGRLVAWQDVQRVSTGTRWARAPVLVVGGRDVELPGMPVADARRLAEALDARPGR